jgi:hypothetical protein
MRKGVITALSVLVVAVLGATAWAVTNFANAPSGTHFARGASEPVCTINESTDTVSCTGTEFAGVGNTNATAVLTVFADAEIECRAPGNDKRVEPHSTSLTDTESANLTPTRNGRLTVNPLTERITTGDVSGAFTCPNENWNQVVTDVDITGFTYTVTFAGFDDPVIAISG